MTAVTYRLLRKRILSSVIRGLNIVLLWINSFIIEREQQQGQGRESKSTEAFLEDVRGTLLPFYRFDTDGSLEEMVGHLLELRSLDLEPSTSTVHQQEPSETVGSHDGV
jgi:hypothetical protein